MTQHLAVIRRCELAVETNEPLYLDDREAFLQAVEATRAVAGPEEGQRQ